MNIFPNKVIILAFSIITTAMGNSAGPDLHTATASNADTLAPLPEQGLKRHDFLLTGEWDYRKTPQTIFVVQNGKVAWSYAVPYNDSTAKVIELGDAGMRGNGNIIFCSKIAVSEITPEKKIIYNYPTPPGTEIHAVQPIRTDELFFVINGVPARAMLVNIKTGKTEKEWHLPTGKPSAHLQFRRVRLLASGNVLAAHLDNDKVSEYDGSGREIWSYAVVKPWSASRLKNGNTLITSAEHHVLEVNAKGEPVWELKTDSIAGIALYQFQEAVRLDNGNTILCNWPNKELHDPNLWPHTAQLLEITPDKKLVWAVSEWKDPDLGPASSIQILDGGFLKKIKAFSQP